VETLSAYANHSWKLTKTYDLKNDTSLNSKISIDKNSYANNVYGNKIYYKSNKAGEKYNLTATHELYTNVTDTVELRTCDIFFNPISCEMIGEYIVNPRGFVYGDYNYYKIEISPLGFLASTKKIIWGSPYGFNVTSQNSFYQKEVNISPLKPASYIYDTEITINIPDYYESPPKFTIRIFPQYTTIKIKPIIIKHGANEYVNFTKKDNSRDEYEYWENDEFYAFYEAKMNNMIDYVNKIYRQHGLNFELDTFSEIIDPNLFFQPWTNRSNIIPINELAHQYNGIKLYLVDSLYDYPNANPNAYVFRSEISPYNKIGIMTSKDTIIESYAHEIGHMLSLLDVYYIDENNNNLFNRFPTASDLPSDFTGEINYYNKKYDEIINSLVMDGVVDPSKNFIIPFGKIFGLNYENEFDLTHVGLSNTDINIKSYGETQ
jgi:hypothetical protein